MRTFFVVAVAVGVLLTALTFVSPCCTGDTWTYTTMPGPIDVPKLVHQRKTAWFKESWLGDDRPYQAVTSAIDHEIAQSRNPRGVWKSYCVQAHTMPYDAMAQYKWVYALYKFCETSRENDDIEIKTNCLAALEGAPSPHTISYARMRYLVADNAELVPLGERLLNKRPGDLWVMNCLGFGYQELAMRTNNRDYIQRSVAMFRELIKSAPKEPVYWLRMGYSYKSGWHHFHDVADFRPTIKAYEHYVAIARPTDWRISISRSKISELNAEMVKRGIKP